MASLPPDAPRPRMCKIRKDYPDQDYGFNLHADRNKGQFIGSIDAGSPAEMSGLRTGDRIVGVNGASVATEAHKQVVTRIKEHALECSLLVIDEQGELWYRERKLPIPVYQDFGNGTLEKKIAIAQKSTPIIETREAKPPPTYNEVTSAVKYMRPKLCKLIKPSPDAEFGFNLHAEKNTGHYIGKVDKDSVAEKAGLEEGQRIVGVNDTLIYPTTPNREVVQMIKSEPAKTELLLATPEVDNWYRKYGKEYSFQEAEIVEPIIGKMALMLSKAPPPAIVENGVATSNGIHKEEHKSIDIPPDVQKEIQISTKPEPVKAIPSPISISPPIPAPAPLTPPKAAEESMKHLDDVKQKQKREEKKEEQENAQEKGPSPTKPERKSSAHFRASADHNAEVQAHLHHQDWMNLSAAELRERINRHKKPDPRNQQLSLLQKYEIVHNL